MIHHCNDDVATARFKRRERIGSTWTIEWWARTTWPSLRPTKCPWRGMLLASRREVSEEACESFEDAQEPREDVDPQPVQPA